MVSSSRTERKLAPTGPGKGRDSGARRAFAVVAVVALALAALLSGVWYYAAGKLDAAVRTGIEGAGGQGVSIDCGHQAVFGYPFRLGLRCDTLRLSAPDRGLRVEGGSLRTAAQVYQPSKIVAELASPLRVEAAGGPPVVAAWELAQASAHFPGGDLDRFALVLTKPTIALAEPAPGGAALASSDHLELHAQKRGDSLDVALLDRSVRLPQLEAAGLPAFDLMSDATIDNAADWLAGERAGTTLGEALAGKTGTLRQLRLAVSAGTTAAGAPLPGIDISGPFQISPERLVSGSFDVAVTEPQAIAGLIATIDPRLAGVAGTLASGLGFAGRTENGRTVVRITIADGAASLGFIPLGRIAPLE